MDWTTLWNEWNVFVQTTKSPPVEWELVIDDLFEEMDGYAVIISYYWNSMDLPIEWNTTEEDVDAWMHRAAMHICRLYPDACVEPYIVRGEGYRAIGIELTR